MSGFGGPVALVVFVFGLALFRLIYIAYASPFTLIEDEAHYWAWAQRLDWSYYSKGPGVAWAIAASTSLLGDTELGVRAPAVIFSAIGTLAVAALARDVASSWRIAWMAVLLYQAMPGVHATGLLMTIDGPFFACWAVAAWCGWLAIVVGSGFAWIGLGAALAVGFLFKYTIVALPPAMLLFAALHGRARAPVRYGWLLGGMAVAILGLMPVGIWNAANDWATVRHLLGHLGVAGGDTQRSDIGWSYSPLWTAEYFLFLLMMSGSALVLGLQAMVNIRRARDGGAGRVSAGGVAYLVWCSTPPAALYLVVSLFTNIEANWVTPVGITLCPLAAWAAADGLLRRDHGVRMAWHAGLLCLVVMIVGPVVLGIAATGRERLLGVPINRVTGADDFAAEAAVAAASLREQTGLEPFYMAVHYGRASLLRFYLPGRPEVYSASAHTGGRRSQFDVWHETDLSQPAVNDRLRGRPAVLFGGEGAPWGLVFGDVREIGPLPSEPKRSRTTWIGEGFLGFDTVITP